MEQMRQPNVFMAVVTYSRQVSTAVIYWFVAFAILSVSSCTSPNSNPVSEFPDGQTGEQDVIMEDGEDLAQKNDGEALADVFTGLDATPDASIELPWYETHLGTVVPIGKLADRELICYDYAKWSWVEDGNLRILQAAWGGSAGNQWSVDAEISSKGIEEITPKLVESTEFARLSAASEAFRVMQGTGVRYELRKLVKTSDLAKCVTNPTGGVMSDSCPKTCVLVALYDDGSIKHRALDIPEPSVVIGGLFKVGNDAVGIAYIRHDSYSKSESSMVYIGFDEALQPTTKSAATTLPLPEKSGSTVSIDPTGGVVSPFFASDGKWIHALVLYNILDADGSLNRKTAAVVSLRPEDGASRHFEIGKHFDVHWWSTHFFVEAGHPDSKFPHSRLVVTAHWPKPNSNISISFDEGKQDAAAIIDLPGEASPTLSAWIPLAGRQLVTAFRRGDSTLMVVAEDSSSNRNPQLLQIGPLGSIERLTQVPALATRPEFVQLCSVIALPKRLVWFWRSIGKKNNMQFQVTWTDLWGWDSTQLSGVCADHDEKSCFSDQSCLVPRCDAHEGCTISKWGDMWVDRCGVDKSCYESGQRSSSCKSFPHPLKPWLVHGGVLDGDL